jgi:phage baseplate assembly protein W
MAVQRISRAFKDISLSFDMHPVTKDILVLKNEDAIKRSIRNLVQTVPTERFFNPTIGADVKTSLFDFVDFGTASVLQKQIEIAIQNYEPRVENPRVVVDPRPDLNAFEITVTFTIVGLEVPRQQFSYILEATR